MTRSTRCSRCSAVPAPRAGAGCSSATRSTASCTRGSRNDWCAPGVSPSVTELWSDRVEPPHAVAAFTRGETVQFLREELHPTAQARLEAEGTLSIICVPVLVDGRLAGYIGYDDCVTPRRWSPAEEEALRAAASVLGLCDADGSRPGDGASSRADARRGRGGRAACAGVRSRRRRRCRRCSPRSARRQTRVVCS